MRTPGALLVAGLLGIVSAGCALKGEGAAFTCETLEARMATCAAELASALDARSGKETTTSQALQAQCITFPERREPLGRCFAATDCRGFASCYAELATDGWRP